MKNLLQRSSTFFNVLQRSSTFFNVLQRSSTWLILCLISIYLSSCRNDVQVVPSDTKTEQLSSEISKIKAWFENNAHASNLTNCNSNRNFQPRWDRSRDGGDRFEFDIFEDGKIPMPKLSGTGLKSGRMKFVSKKNNGNGNANGQGMIVSFIPFQSFTGDITKVSTSNFRVMNFDGIIAFDELNGCSGNAYKVDNGVVMNKLTIALPNQLNLRCGESYTSTTYHYTMVSSPAYPQNGCTISYYAAGTSTTYGVPCLDAPVIFGGGSNYGSSPGSSSDATYSGYLAVPPYTCPSSFVFFRIDNATSMSQQAAISNIKATVPGLPGGANIDVNLGTLWFKAPTELATTGMSEAELNFHVTNALNLGEDAMRNARNTGITDASMLANIWRTVASEKFQKHSLFGSNYIDPAYLISSYSLIPEQTNVQIKPHISCN